VFWALQWWGVGRSRVDAPVAMTAEVPVPAPTPAWRVLSSAQSSVIQTTEAPEQGWQLLGVVASSAGRGSALLAQAGNPARTWLVGQSLDGQWRLVKVAPGQAWLAPVQADASAPPLLALKLPEEKPAAAASRAASGPAS
jgi:hypothetical protein